MSHLRHQKYRKLAFYIRGFFEYLFVPDFIYRNRISKWFDLTGDYDSEELEFRVNYYNKLDSRFSVPDKALALGQLPKKSKTYFLDLRRVLRYFPSLVRSYFRFGDIVDSNEDKKITLSDNIVKFKKLLLHDQLDRLKKHSINCEIIKIKDIKIIRENIYALYPSVGENLDFVALNKLENIQFLYRKIDQFSWKYCNKGFFNFKKYIPKIIQNIS